MEVALPAVLSFISAASGPTEDNADIDSELQPYLDGSKLPPIPSYFIGAYGQGCVTALKALQQSGSVGLTYLGRSGLETLQGLRVAFLDGTYSSLEYTQGTAEHSSTSACRHFTKVRPFIPALTPSWWYTSAWLSCAPDGSHHIFYWGKTYIAGGCASPGACC